MDLILKNIGVTKEHGKGSWCTGSAQLTPLGFDFDTVRMNLKFRSKRVED